MSLGQRQDLLLLGPPMVLVECYIRLHFRQEVGKLATAALLVARQRLPEHTDLLGARPVLALQPVQQRSGFRMTQAQEPEQVLVLLGVWKRSGYASVQRISSKVHHRASPSTTKQWAQNCEPDSNAKRSVNGTNICSHFVLRA